MTTKTILYAVIFFMAISLNQRLSALPPAFQKLELIEEINVSASPRDDGSFKEFP